MEGIDIQAIVKEAVRQCRAEDKYAPAYQAELQEERKRREMLERRLNELVAENRRGGELAEKAEISSAVRAGLQRLGIVKVGILSRGIEADVQRNDAGALVIVDEGGEVSLREYLGRFVRQNPEFLQPGVDVAETAQREAALRHYLEEIERLASQPRRGLI